MKISAIDKTYYKCRNCGDEIFWNTHKKLVFCRCEAVGVDGCEYYVRLIGNEKDVEIVDKALR